MLGRSDGYLDQYNFEMHNGGSGIKDNATKIGGYVAGRGNSFYFYVYGKGKLYNYGPAVNTIR